MATKPQDSQQVQEKQGRTQREAAVGLNVIRAWASRETCIACRSANCGTTTTA